MNVKFKRALTICLALLMPVLLLSCTTPVIYTRSEPYVVENATLAFDNASLNQIENDLDPHPNLLMSFEDFCDNMEESNTAKAILLVHVENTQSVYWNDNKGDKAGYGITKVSVIKILDQNAKATTQGFGDDKTELTFWEPYTVSPEGELLFPIYSGTQFTEIFIDTHNKNPIMKQDGYYLIRFSGIKWSDGEIGDMYPPHYQCYLTKSELDVGNGTIINKEDCPIYSKYKDVYFSPSSHIYEFSEEAYERSKTIVEQYESEGKTREDGSYYLYHAMVVDAWERYGSEISSEE